MAHIPDSAQKVYDGVFFDAYQWKQEMFDGTTRTFEMLKRSDAVISIATSTEGRVLIIDEKQPHDGHFRSFASGSRDDGESPLDGAKRELLEETGVASSDWELLHHYTPIGRIDMTIYVFVARDVTEKHVMQQSAGEITTPVWLTFDELLALHDQPFRMDYETRLLITRAYYDTEVRNRLHQKLFDKPLQNA